MSKRNQILIIVLSILVFLIVIVGILFNKVLKDIEAELAQLSQLTILDIDLNVIADGEYLGEYESFPILARVVVTVKNHVITDITLLEHKTGQGQEAKEILRKIIDAQSVKVDVITHATYSSIVIQKAVEIALSSSQ